MAVIALALRPRPRRPARSLKQPAEARLAEVRKAMRSKRPTKPLRPTMPVSIPARWQIARPRSRTAIPASCSSTVTSEAGAACHRGCRAREDRERASAARVGQHARCAGSPWSGGRLRAADVGAALEPATAAAICSRSTSGRQVAAPRRDAAGLGIGGGSRGSRHIDAAVDLRVECGGADGDAANRAGSRGNGCRRTTLVSASDHGRADHAAPTHPHSRPYDRAGPTASDAARAARRSVPEPCDRVPRWSARSARQTSAAASGAMSPA